MMKILNILSNKMLKLDFKFIKSQSKKLLIKKWS